MNRAAKVIMILFLVSLFLSAPSSVIAQVPMEHLLCEIEMNVNAMSASSSEPYQACMATTHHYDETAMQAVLLDAVTIAAEEAIGEVKVSSTFYYEVGDQYCITAEFTSVAAPVKYESCMGSTDQYDEATMQSMLLDAVTSVATEQMGEVVVGNVTYYESGDMYCISAEFTPAEMSGTGGETKLDVMLYLPILMR